MPKLRIPRVVSVVVALMVGLGPAPAGASGAPAGWKATTGHLPGGFVSVSCPDVAHCWAVGTTSLGTNAPSQGSAMVAFSADLGSTWTQVQTISTVPGLVSISCPTDSACLAVGFNDGNTVGGLADHPVGSPAHAAAFITTDGWSTWQQAPVPFQDSDHPWVVSCADEQHCQIAGYAVNSQNLMATPLAFSSSDGAQSWSRSVVGPQELSGFGDGVSCPDGSDCWLSVDDGQIAVSHDAGATWTTSNPVGSGGARRDLSSISCPSTSRCLAAGAGALVTDNGGRTWQATPLGLDNQADVVCPDSSSCRAVTGGFAATTHDFGTSWSEDITPVTEGQTTARLYGVTCPTTAVCLAAGALPSINQAGSWLTTAGGVFGGYWLADAAGGVFSFGQAPFFGSLGGRHLSVPVSAMAPLPDGAGYWLATTTGGVYEFSAGRSTPVYVAPPGPLSGHVVDVVWAHGSSGYLVTDTGAVYSINGAPYHGGLNNRHLNAPVVGMAVYPNGYWLVAADGGVFSFGGGAPELPGSSPSSRFFGSMGGKRLARPVVGMAATPDQNGYWLVAADGGIFSFGDAHFYGSTGALHLAAPIVGMVAPEGGGYWLAAADGGVFSFGDPRFYGSAGNIRLARPVVGMA